MGAQFEFLSTEILLKIFEYCCVRDLYQLQDTCTKFRKIIRSATNLGNAVPILVTNHIQQGMRNKCMKLLTMREKCIISYNWKNGIYKERYISKTTKKYIPWLVLTKDHLWLSKGSDINAYERHNNAFKSHQNIYSIGLSNVETCKFVYKQNCLVSGLQNGDIIMWKSKDDKVHLKNCHREDVHSVDLDRDIIVSGSRDESVKLWDQANKDHLFKPLHSYDMNDRVWSVAFSSEGQRLAVGTAGLNSVPPLHIIDTNSSVILQRLGWNFRQGSGILHIKWENPYILLSCGYDKNVRKWDMRTGACEQSWEDPYYSTVYCFDTDNYCTILTGTDSHGRAVLWDMRVKKHIQVYFMGSCKKRYSSPIYSISFDASTLFTATDRCLNIIDFSSKNGIKRDYSY